MKETDRAEQTVHPRWVELVGNSFITGFPTELTSERFHMRILKTEQKPVFRIEYKLFTKESC